VGGGVLGYRDLVNALGENQPFYGLQAFGQDNHETCDTSIESMASRYIDAIRSFQPKGPYKIGGYCFGGVVAYEMACQLEKMGEQVSLLAIFEGFLPNAPKKSVPFQQRLRLFWHSLPHWVQDYTGMRPYDLRHRASSTLFKLWAKVRRHPDLQRRARVQDILETDLDGVPTRIIELTEVHSQAFHSYVPSPYGGKITLFRARIRSFNEVVFGSLDPHMGWGSLAKGGVAVNLVDGFHRNVHLPP
jgi:thioesterase domain-containing protein